MQTGSLGHMPMDKLLLSDRYVTGQKSPSQALLASLTLAGQRKAEILQIRPCCARCCINTEQKKDHCYTGIISYYHVERNHLLNLSDHWSQRSYSRSRFLLYHTHRNTELFGPLQTCNKICTTPVLNAFFVHYSSLLTTVQKIGKEIKRSLRYIKYFCPKYAKNLTQ